MGQNDYWQFSVIARHGGKEFVSKSVSLSPVRVGEAQEAFVRMLDEARSDFDAGLRESLSPLFEVPNGQAHSFTTDAWED